MERNPYFAMLGVALVVGAGVRIGIVIVAGAEVAGVIVAGVIVASAVLDSIYVRKWCEIFVLRVGF